MLQPNLNGSCNFSRRDSRCAEKLPTSGFTLVELLITMVVISIIAGSLVPLLQTTAVDRLTAAAQILTSDLEVARNLAVTYQSKYRITFTPHSDRYFLEHSGTSTLLNALPDSPFSQANDPNTRRTTDLTSAVGNGVSVLGIERGGMLSAVVGTIEFTALGNTSNSAAPTVWLQAGNGSETRYIPITVNPTTGLATIGDLTAHRPGLAVAANFSFAPGSHL